VFQDHPRKGKRRKHRQAMESHHMREFAALLELAKKSPVDSIEAVVADWFILIRITGLHCAEYAQKTQSTFNEHKYPSSKRVIKAFISTD
jgi:hypothetical protein